MYQLQIEFCHPQMRDEVFILKWKLLDHMAAAVWLELFIECLKSEDIFFSRFTGFIGGEKNQTFLMQQLNKCIDIINEDGRYKLKEKGTEFTQEFSNIIHHSFEVLRGHRDFPTEYYKNSSEKVAKAVRGLNYYIHDLEALERNTKSEKIGVEDSTPFSGVIVEIKNCKRLMIPSIFNCLFTTNIDFGDLVVHYSQLGKTWPEAFYDKDEEIFREAILPHYALSGEFDILFGELRPDENFTKDFGTFLRGKGLDPNDSSLRLGHLPLAKLINESGVSQRELKKELKKKLASFCDIKGIKVFHNKELLAERSLTNSADILING
ncbi:MAG: hypothetical protein PHY93_17245 [Bacteriovorax sp.]|nr:hypothetical protein [Bacteriovorax sp.]